jgi:hypothetical protein
LFLDPVHGGHQWHQLNQLVFDRRCEEIHRVFLPIHPFELVWLVDVLTGMFQTLRLSVSLGIELTLFILQITIHISHKALGPEGFRVPTWLCRMHTVMYSWNCVFHMMVVVVYWIFLSDNFTKSINNWGRLSSVCMHGVELFIVFCEIGLGAMTINWVAFVPVLILLACYTTWALIYHWG